MNAESEISEDRLETIGLKLAPYNPTNVEAIEVALDLLKIVDDDVIYDLGCGDARFLIQACSKVTKIRCIGIEYDLKYYEKACMNVISNNLEDKIKIIHDNVLNINFIEDATVLFIYLVPEGMNKLRENLIKALDKGVRIVTYVFSIPDLSPSQVVLYKGSTKIYLYVKS